ncbi:MAG: dephospho-CoA kinase [Propionibacteriaceae bacterium]|jgi:dephospho-CoA kinase|nr:dephospho-CoA kinase [Propionibacteriaceae bacterium]
MIRVGLTGGIAAGKTVAGARFEELGITVIDYDQLAREVVAPGTPGLAAVVATFGPAVLAVDGTLNRALVAQKVFSGDDEDALDKLESIVHPLVIARGHELDQEAEARGERLIIHSIPLLVEVVGPEAFDTVIVVDAPPEIRVARLVAGRRMSEAEAWDRIDAQSDDSVRLEAADVVFDGSGPEDNLRRQVTAWAEDVLRNGLNYRPNPERSKFLVTEDWVA